MRWMEKDEIGMAVVIAVILLIAVVLARWW
jgi:FlaG/FlaF family flagellin (archaellin)